MRKGTTHTLDAKAKMSLLRKGRKLTPEHKEKVRLSGIGRKHSESTKRKISESRMGDKNPNWNGGVGIRMRNAGYHKWRLAIFPRDNYTCRKCHQRGGKLNAHHIYVWRKYPEKRFEIRNGITLCYNCHRSIHKKPIVCDCGETTRAYKCFNCNKVEVALVV